MKKTKLEKLKSELELVEDTIAACDWDLQNASEYEFTDTEINEIEANMLEHQELAEKLYNQIEKLENKQPL